MKVLAVVLAVVSAAVFTVGVGLVYPPAGVIVAGLVGLSAAYVVAYFGADR